jgi:ATP/maltotriose-dependent transcriptional regulator MalT
VETPGGREAIPSPAPYEVARPHALARLRARLTAERRVALSGLAGMGKTTLAAALARDYALSAPVFWLTLAAGITTSVELLNYQLALFLRGHGQTQIAPLLRPLLEVETALSLSQQITLLAEALNRLADGRPQPPLLCLDNVDLVQDDEAVVQVLRYLMATTPTAMLLTSREEVLLPDVAQVRLAGLERAEAWIFIRQLVGAPADPAAQKQVHEKTGTAGNLSPAQIERLLDKTGGNPMLLRLALGQLLDGYQPIDPDHFIAHLETQPQVAAYLLETLQQRLAPATWRLLLLISLLRQPVDLYDEGFIELSQAADGPYDLAVARTELQRRHLIDHPGQADLHPLVRDYVYATLVADPPRRRRLHQAVAEWTDQELGRPVEAAYHYLRAGQPEAVGDVLSDQAEAIINRGRRLATLAVVDEALLQARRKRGSPTDLVRRLLTIRGDLLVGTLRAAEAEADYREALALPAAPAVRAHITWRLAQSLTQRGQAAAAVQLCRDVAATIDPTDTLLLARLAGIEAHAHWTLSHFDEAIRVGLHTLTLADQLAPLTPLLADNIRAHAYHTLSNVYYFRRVYQTALEHSRQLVATAHRAGLRALEYVGLTILGALMIEYVGQLDLALYYLEQAEAGFEELGHSYSLGNALGFKAIAHYLRHEPELAQRTFAQTEKMLRQVGDLEGVATYQTDRGLYLLEQGQVAEARTLAERLLAEFNLGHETCWHTMYTMYLLGLAQMVDGDIHAALTTLRRGLALPVSGLDPSVEADLQSALALGLLSLGDLAGAQQILDQAPLGDMGIWSELNRQCVNGALALARGEITTIAAIAAALIERANAAGYRIYALRATRLVAASQAPPPPAAIPRLLWVNTPPAPLENSWSISLP